MFGIPFEKISLQDIQGLVSETKERENAHLEYKEKIDDPDDLRKAVCGLANGGGGYLIIGVAEDDEGLPKEICGVDKLRGNQAIDEWIGNVLASSIEPPVRTHIRLIRTDADRLLIVLHIPESIKKPHMLESRHTYPVRHIRSVDPATDSEVRDMFEFSRRQTDKVETFLRKRNLLDADSPDFGVNENSNKLFNYSTDQNMNVGHYGAKVGTPVLLFSFIPTYIEDGRVNAGSRDFLSWLEANCQGFEPVKEFRLFYPFSRSVNLNGVVYPKLDCNDSDLRWHSYFEILDNGFFETGVSSDVFFKFDDGPLIFNLNGTITYLSLLIEFARAFYRHCEYHDDVIIQLSAVNVREAVLGVFGKKNAPQNWPGRKDYLRKAPPVCVHAKFALQERFAPAKVSHDEKVDLLRNLDTRLSRACGFTGPRCFQDSGELDMDGIQWFRDWA